jgi:hypothetical protein
MTYREFRMTCATAIVAALPLWAGCGNACDEVADKFEECGYEAPDVEVEGEVEAEEQECNEAREKQAECLLDQSCDALMSGEAFSECAG